MKCKFFIGWSLGDAAARASGITYNGEDPITKKPRFDRFFSMDIMGVETSIFSSAVTEAWNHHVHVWLKRSIFFRMNRKINKDLALYITYVFSAFWHGFYPIYFCFFVTFAIVTENHKDFYILSTKYKILRSLPCLVLFLYFIFFITCNSAFTYIVIAYIGMAFDMLLFRYIKQFVSGIYWVLIVHLAFFLIFKFTSTF